MTSFLFPLKEIRAHAGTDDLVGTRLIARALVKVKLENQGVKGVEVTVPTGVVFSKKLLLTSFKIIPLSLLIHKFKYVTCGE